MDIPYSNAYEDPGHAFPGEEALGLFNGIKPYMTKPMTHDEILGLMYRQNPTADPAYHNRMFHRLVVAGRIRNEGFHRYLPNVL